MLEVFTHNVLYLRRAYPHGIFQPRRLYRCIVYRSRFPPLNEYINNALQSAMFLHKSGILKKFEVVLYTPTPETKLESYFFEFRPPKDSADSAAYTASSSKTRTGWDQEEYKKLESFVEKMRIVLLTLNSKCKNLSQLPERFQFKINLHTTQSGLKNLTEDERLQEFPWILQEDQERAVTADIIVPIADISGIQLFVENYI